MVGGGVVVLDDAAVVEVAAELVALHLAFSYVCRTESLTGVSGFSPDGEVGLVVEPVDDRRISWRARVDRRVSRQLLAIAVLGLIGFGTVAVVGALDGPRVMNGITPVEPGGDERPGDRISIESDEPVSRAESDAIFADRIEKIQSDPDEWGCRTPDGGLFTMIAIKSPDGSDLVPSGVPEDRPSERPTLTIPPGCIALDGEASIEQFTNGRVERSEGQ